MRADEMPELPESDAPLDGATAGSMQGATRGQVKKGFTNADTDRDPFETMMPSPGGFLGRSQGWER